MDESIFTTTGIYIIVGASYVNLISLFAQLARANVCRFLTTRHTRKKKNRIKFSAAYVSVSALDVKWF